MEKGKKPGRRSYTQEFKLEAVRLVRTGIAKARVARDLGIHLNVLKAWLRQFDHMTTQLVADAMTMAVWRRRPKAAALLTHSDQGSQYANELYQLLLADNGIQCSMSRTGNVWDNSAMESFFSSLKIERVHARRYRTRDEARSDIFDYIECF